MPGSMAIRGASMPAAISRARRVAQVVEHVADHVVVSWIILHGPRAALHVHQTHATA